MPMRAPGTTRPRYLDEAGPRERIAWDEMKLELTEANERCVRLRQERDELKREVEVLQERRRSGA
jgi:hypothetical protein